MTDNERANKVYLARLKYGKPFIHELPLPKHDISVGRKTPKSEFLKQLEENQKMIDEKYLPLKFPNPFDGSDLGHFKGMFDVYVGNK